MLYSRPSGRSQLPTEHRDNIPGCKARVPRQIKLDADIEVGRYSEAGEDPGLYSYCNGKTVSCIRKG